MDALINVIENAAILVGGLAVRFAVAVVLLALLVSVLLPFLFAGEGVRQLWRRFAGFGSEGGLTWRRGTYYSPAHAWLRTRAGFVRLGLDDLAGRLLRRVDAVALPAVGTYVKEGDALLTVSAGPRGVVLPSPVEGVVARVNPRLGDTPQSLVDDPYGRGWLLEVDPASDSFRSMKHDEAARQWMHTEAVRLSLALERATGILAADGGELAVPSHLLISEEQRAALEQQFLRALTKV
ncbi:MAG: glycine cleavage system protein H [Acidobacteria bacterium]|nr:glycine cleavage system protein H [Acidobacteriota bacterium]